MARRPLPGVLAWCSEPRLMKSAATNRSLSRCGWRVLARELRVAAVEDVLDDVAAGLVRGVPARADRDVGDAGVAHVVGAVPADGVADLDRGARAIALVAGGVRAVVPHTVLHVDEPGEIGRASW